MNIFLWVLRVSGAVALMLPIIASAAGEEITPAMQANHEGNVAYYAQRYEEARANYERALAFAEKSGNKEYEAIAMYGLARTQAQLCQQPSADKWFQQSISVREKLPDTQDSNLTQMLLEYGRFLASWSRHSDAVKFYDRSMPILASVGIEKIDPLGYALVLDEYEAILKSAGRIEDATAVAGRAKLLRETHKGQSPGFVPEPYPDCAKQ
jgi:tetratricopeptide (TPR) repeat protein